MRGLRCFLKLSKPAMQGRLRTVETYLSEWKILEHSKEPHGMRIIVLLKMSSLARGQIPSQDNFPCLKRRPLL